MKFIVTGVTGYIGSRIASLMLLRGHTVIGLSRQKPKNSSIIWVPYDMAQKSNAISGLFSNAQAIIHLAASTFSLKRIEEYPDLEAAKHLIALSKKSNKKFIFISSQTARADAPTNYGKIKWLIEREVISAGGVVVRPGQVYGGQTRGLFGTITRLVDHFPVLPEFSPDLLIQPIHLDDLAEAIINIIERPVIGPEILCLGAPDPVPFTNFLSALAVDRLRRRRIFVPFPKAPISYALEVVFRLFNKKPFLNQLYSLFNLPIMETSDGIKIAGLKLRSLSNGMHPSGNIRRRKLLLEGKSLITYIFQKSPRLWILRRYVRAVESLGNGRPVNLPNIFITHPGCLALVDAKKPGMNGFYTQISSRMDIATTIAEATPQGAICFLGAGLKSSRLIALFTLGQAVMSELSLRFVRFLISPIIERVIKRAFVA